MESARDTPIGLSEPVEQRFVQLERTLEQFQENVRHLGVIATDFTPRSQEPLNQKIHTLFTGLQELDGMKHEFDDVKVPLELLGILDHGKNPQLYTKEMLERTQQKNKEVNGKIEMYKKFNALLLRQLGDKMPQDTAMYRQLRDRDRETREREQLASASHQDQPSSQESS